MFVLLIVMCSKGFSDSVNDILSSLHFDSFNWKPSAQDFVTNSSTRDCIELVPFFFTHSARVVSSTYFQMLVFVTLKSLIIIRNNQGPRNSCWYSTPYRYTIKTQVHPLPSVRQEIQNPAHDRFRKVVRGELLGLGHGDQLSQRLCESQTIGSLSSPISVIRFQPGIQHTNKRMRSRRFRHGPELLRINPLQHSRFDISVNHIIFGYLRIKWGLVI